MPRSSVLILAALLLASSAAIAQDVAVEYGSPMLYLANSTDPGLLGMEWAAADYDDSGWSSGTYGIGYENNLPGATPLIQTVVPNTTRSVYTRTTFHVSDVSQIYDVLVGADYDDGYVAWINGVEVYRAPGLVGKTLTWDVLASDHESSNGPDPDYSPLRDVSALALPELVDGDNVFAVAAFNGSVVSSDLVVVPQLLLNKILVRGPFLQQASANSVLVRWRTSAPNNSRVLCGPAPGSLIPCAEDPTITAEHEVTVTGLAPNTRYYYAIGSYSATLTGRLAGDDDDHFFDTAPPTGIPAPTRVWVLGDSGTGSRAARLVREAYLGFAGSQYTDLILMLGDNAYSTGTDLDFQRKLFEDYQVLLRSSPVWPTEGNHDIVAYFDSFTLPTAAEAGGLASGTEDYYSFDHANIHFVVLNSQQAIHRAPGSAMQTWLATDLADTAADWIVVTWHHPPYSKGSHDSDNQGGSDSQLVQMRENVVPILEDYGVDLVLAGHSHSFERSFLIDGHYGDSSTFVPTMKVDGGDGVVGGDGAYVKPYRGSVPYSGNGDGAVYTVAGSSGQLATGLAIDLGGPEPNHPAHVRTLLSLGSVVLDVNGNRLDARFLNEFGVVQDHYTVFKGQETELPIADFAAVPLSAASPGIVFFTDQTQNGPTVWSWDLDGDGQTDATTPSASHVYSQPGLYTVELSVSNSAGADQEIKTDYVCVTDGVPDVITGLGIDGAGLLAWDPNVRATRYDVVKGDLLHLASTGDLTGSQIECLVAGVEAQLSDPSGPAPGQAWFYVNRGLNCADQAGTYDTADPAQAGLRDGPLQGAAAVCSCPTADDLDGDGYCAALDNCPGLANDQQDSDADGVGDACDNCPDDPNPGQVDLDGDGFGQPCDNCVHVFNPSQYDPDGNGIGQACECTSVADCDDHLDCSTDLCLFDVTQPIGQCRHLTGNCP